MPSDLFLYREKRDGIQTEEAFEKNQKKSGKMSFSLRFFSILAKIYSREKLIHNGGPIT